MLSSLALFSRSRSPTHSLSTPPTADGSGLASTLFSLTTAGDTSKIAELADLDNRLAARDFRSAEEFTETLERRETRYNTKGWVPEGDPENDLYVV